MYALREESDKSMVLEPENKVYVSTELLGATGQAMDVTTQPIVKVRLAVSRLLPLELTCAILML